LLLGIFLVNISELANGLLTLNKRAQLSGVVPSFEGYPELPVESSEAQRLSATRQMSLLLGFNFESSRAIALS
jgi:hypothetical protein